MNTSALTTLLLFLVVFHGLHGLSTAATPLEELCSSLGGFYVTPELCTSTLCQDPACHTAADVPALAVIASKLAVANATAIKSNIEAALSRSAPEAKKGIQACLQLYTGAIPSMQWVASSVAAKRYPGAREVAQLVQYIALGCSGMAGDALSKENDWFSTTAIVSHAILASISS